MARIEVKDEHGVVIDSDDTNYTFHARILFILWKLGIWWFGRPWTVTLIKQ